MPANRSAFDARLAADASAVEESLSALLGEATLPGEVFRPKRLMDATARAFGRLDILVNNAGNLAVQLC